MPSSNNLETTQMADQAAPEHRDFEALFVDCSLAPSNEQTKQFLDQVLLDLEYSPRSRSKAGVHSLLISLFEAQQAIGGRDHILVAIPANETHWTSDELLTRQIARTIRTKLIDAGWLNLRRRGFNGSPFYGRVSCDLFAVNMPQIESYLDEASVMSNRANLSATTRSQTNSHRRAIPSTSDAHQEFIRLNEIIASGDVKLGRRIAIAGVNRRFSDFRSRRGGRFFHPYTSKPSATRLSEMTIGNQPVCEVDISACSLTMLASMSGFELPATDAYEGFSESDREIAKALIVKMFGSGRSNVHTLSLNQVADLNDIGIEANVNQSELASAIRQKYPFLENLRPGELDSETMAYWESEIVQAAIFKLHEDDGIVGCPMHDAVIIHLS